MVDEYDLLGRPRVWKKAAMAYALAIALDSMVLYPSFTRTRETMSMQTMRAKVFDHLGALGPLERTVTILSWPAIELDNLCYEFFDPSKHI